MSEKIIFSMVGVGKTVAQKKIMKDIYLSFFFGAKIGVLGLNGSGKSTLLRIMAGVDKEFLGEVHLSDGYTVGFLPQEPYLESGKTVREIVREGAGEVAVLLKEFDEINASFAEPMSDDQMEKVLKRQADVQERLDALDAWTLDDRLNYAMEALTCPPADQLVDNLSGGERRRVALCKLLLQEPDILLLDEPTNHLDAESVHWLERHLQQYKGTVIAVTHDRYFLDNVARWILELDRGHGVPWKGNYSSWLDQKQKRLSDESNAEDKRGKTLQKELEWIQMSPRARQAKNKARISAYESMLKEEHEKVAEDLHIYIPSGPRLGKVVIEAKDLSKSYGDKVLFDKLNFNLPPGGIIGVVGPNGMGKTTLFRLMAGEDKPDSGELTVGETVKLGYMEQSRLSLDGNKTVWEAITDGQETIKLGKREVNSRAYVGRFNFSGNDQQKKVEILSGGERNRLQLANLLKEQANLILLDEPTNDLDVNTLRALEEALINYAGCVVVISHDRWFLDRVATHILAFEGDGKISWFEGNFSDYEEDKIKRLTESGAIQKNRRYMNLKRV